jgi:hypothetical protein
LARFLLPRKVLVSAAFGEVHVSADRLERFDDEPPAGRRLQRDLKLLS